MVVLKVLVEGVFGSRVVPRGGVPFLAQLFKNPPDGVEYVISGGKAGWADSKHYPFLANVGVVGAVERDYSRSLRGLARSLGWRFTELKKVEVDLKSGVDLMLCNHEVVSSNIPCVSYLEGDFVLLNHPEYSPVKGVDMNTPAGRLYQRTVLKHILLKKNLKRILFWSDIARERTLKVFPEISGKSLTLHPPVEPPRDAVKRKSDGPVRICFVGSDWVRKGLMILLDVYSKLRKSLDVSLTVVTHESFQSTEPGADVRVLYNLPHAEVHPRIYQESDIFVLPTKFETYGYSALEAMSCGLPVVASDVYALPEIVEDGVTGFLTPYGDVAALEDRLRGLIEDSGLRERMGRAGRRRVEEKFSTGLFRGRLGGIYEESVRP